MVWDGACTFCAYWITRWSKITGTAVDYAPYQEVAGQFKDVNQRHFMTASRLIETDGSIYSGPQSAYRSFTYRKNKWGFLNQWYETKPWFTRLSDNTYQWVVKNRNFLYKLSTALWGKNPEEPRPFWVIYLAVCLYILYLLF